MHLKYLLSVILFVSFINVSGQEVSVEGTYNGKNLFISNPGVGNGFCVTEVWVNGKKTRDELNSNSFEIDFPQMGIEIGSNIYIRIFHRNGCQPIVVNPDVIHEKFDFSFNNLKVNRKGFLVWDIKGNCGEGIFTIEQFRWKKWVKAGEIKSKDTTGFNSYALEINPNTGQNSFRIKFKDEKSKETTSKEIKYTQPGKEIMIVTEKVKDRIAFTATTMYEIVDEAGNLITTGTEKYIDTSELPKGKYYINYDNKAEVFSKK
jgi:hypothetical protein